MTYEFVETKVSNKSRAKDVGDGSSNIRQHGNTEPDVGFRVHEDLQALVPLPLVGSSSSLIGSESLLRLLLLEWSEESGGLDVVVEEEPNKWSAGDSQDAGYHIDCLPRFDLIRIDMAL